VTVEKQKAIMFGTGIAAVAFWGSLLVGTSSSFVALVVLSIGVILSMLVLAGYSREDDRVQYGIRAAIAGLFMGALLFTLAGLTGSLTIGLLIPVAMLAVGGMWALPGMSDPQVTTMRLIVTGIGAALVIFAAFFAEELWALFAPLVPLPGLGLADRLAERSKED
jgi:hypothetical protein